MSGRGRVGFLKPQEDGESYEEDRPDIQPLRFYRNNSIST